MYATRTTSESPGRRYRLSDRILMEMDQALRTVFCNPVDAGSPHPDDGIPETELGPAGRRESARLMRVNHAGEISAQALYQSQSWFGRDAQIREALRQSARDEHQHLAWCGRRLEDLGAGPSLLAPLVYSGSLGIGALAGVFGDRWSLGFVAETENQVIRHIDNHLDRLPPEDLRSRAILDRMKYDEAHHGETARRAGGRELPAPVRWLMRRLSKLMTTSTYHL
ncbi:MAG TPA: 2-polyprenyl-3-methyl-6-methoxy-1,4-benzoquinone monooxygenase [Gammaproteobacteria bacterium]|nr:2-polyprenyl-3-methyl-6-methoxy-1,4-benzoquinone monooxygenase [Gammaproteobacteria bacterium]